MSDRNKQPRRLLHIFSTFKVGGPQVRFVDIANRLGGSYYHDLVAMDDRYECADRLDPHVRLNLHRGAGQGFHDGFLPARLRRMTKFLRENKPDLLVTYNWGSIEWTMANLTMKLPHVHVEDGFGPEESLAQLSRRAVLRRLLLRRVDRLVIPSRTLVRIAKESWKVDPHRIVYVPNGIDADRFCLNRRDLPDPIFKSPPGRLVIGTIGALRAEKNIRRLIDAVAMISIETRPFVVVAGSGPERAALERRVRQLDLESTLVFVGHVDAPERLLPHFDVFVVSSDTEQMPYSVLEAMSAGLPIASVDVGDIKTMVSDANKEFIQGRDKESLRRSIAGLLQSERLREQIAAANRDKARREFSLGEMITRYSALFDNVIVGENRSNAVTCGEGR